MLHVTQPLVSVGVKILPRHVGRKCLRGFSVCNAHLQTTQEKNSVKESFSHRLAKGPDFGHFLHQRFTPRELKNVSHPYVTFDDVNGHGRKVYFQVFGCQMNESDAEIALSVLLQNGYEITKNQFEADVILIVTCSIRDSAEQKIWALLHHIKTNVILGRDVKVGVLGCMAERIKGEFLEKKGSPVSIVAGPDSYMDLPRLLAISYEGEKAVNVLLSHDETYADVRPVSLSSNNVTAFVSIMRGCDNMCTYCIVPFTRGKERSRPISSIVEEIRHLSDMGIREVTLVGQNVNSYRDLSTKAQDEAIALTPQNLAKGFQTLYKPKVGGLRFADLLDKVSAVDPEMRVRFTSPHPKDFPDEVLQVINERANICNSLHLPAQSGNSRVLQLMRRGYTREAYIDLVDHVRECIPGVELTSDFIAGFCSETEEEFEQTLTLVERVGYDFCFLFAYSMREKTGAHRKFQDNVPFEVKIERLEALKRVFRKSCEDIQKAKIGQRHLVLIEKDSRRSHKDFVGKSGGCTKVIVPKTELPVLGAQGVCLPKPGDYVEVEIVSATSQSLHGKPIAISSIAQFYKQ